MRLTTAICVLFLAIAPAIAQKSRLHHRIAEPVAIAPSIYDCGHNVTLHLSAPDPTQGSLLLLELRSATQAVAHIKATLDNREIPFWQEPKTDEKSPHLSRALLGVDLESKPESYPLTPAGTPVCAAQRARAALAEPLYFSGNSVVLGHGLGLYSFYAHFESISVQPGDLLSAGALLGKVGATGRVTGPHLHWGATVNRARTNPLQLISLPL